MRYNKSITATVYVINDGKVLLHQHKKYNTWFPLGGHIEENEFPHEAAIREVRNNVNRQNNCLNANLNKTIGASVRQLNAIKTIQENIGLEALSEGLMELALLRLANPEASLEELRALSTQKLTKSGINHRFAKILETAQKIEKDKLRITTI